jgi:hypothetical protein
MYSENKQEEKQQESILSIKIKKALDQVYECRKDLKFLHEIRDKNLIGDDGCVRPGFNKDDEDAIMIASAFLSEAETIYRRLIIKMEYYQQQKQNETKINNDDDNNSKIETNEEEDDLWKHIVIPGTPKSEPEEEEEEQIVIKPTPKRTRKRSNNDDDDNDDDGGSSSSSSIDSNGEYTKFAQRR